MCRFALYMGVPILVSTIITEPKHSIINQSYASNEQKEPLNGDGFGLSWYPTDSDKQPALFTSIKPAWSNRNLLHLAAVIKSHCILAHIRAATPGMPVTELNCHPFSWENLTMMHNGIVSGFKKIKREIINNLKDDYFHWIQGSTDSEYLFAYFIQNYNSSNKSSFIDKTTEAIRLTINFIEKLNTKFNNKVPSMLNLVVSNGKSSVISRYASGKRTQGNSLHYIEGKEVLCKNNICHIIQSETEDNSAIIVASEPLTDKSQWHCVKNNHFVCIDEQLNIFDFAI